MPGMCVVGPNGMVKSVDSFTYTYTIKFTFQNVKSLPIQNNYPFPSAKTDIQRVTIASAEVLTGCDALKTALKLTLDISVSISGVVFWLHLCCDAYNIWYVLLWC